MPTCHPLVGEPDLERLLTCPYEPSHRVSHKRLQFHLTKCRKGHPNAKKEVCPYNATHMINEQEFQFHLEVCPSKGIVDSYKYVTPNESHAIELPPEPVLPAAEENWDNDYSETYDPIARVLEEGIIHSFIGGTRSERKKCRAQQRQKFRALDEAGPSCSKAQPKPKEQRKKVSEDQPLRQPTSLPEQFRNHSDKFASLNRSFASGISDAGASTSKEKEGASGVLDNGRKVNGSTRIPDSVRGAAGTQNRPGPPQDGDNDFVVFKPKGRGKFRN